MIVDPATSHTAVLTPPPPYTLLPTNNNNNNNNRKLLQVVQALQPTQYSRIAEGYARGVGGLLRYVLGGLATGLFLLSQQELYNITICSLSPLLTTKNCPRLHLILCIPILN